MRPSPAGAPPACWHMSHRCRAAGWATGRPPVRGLAGRRGGVLVAGPAPRPPPTSTGPPTARRRPSPAGPGLLERPDAPGCRWTRRTGVPRPQQASWIDDWSSPWSGGREAVRDQVRFDREWTALRGHAAERGVRIIGDVPIYVAEGSVDHLLPPRAVPRRRRRRGAPRCVQRHRSGGGATRSTTGPPSSAGGTSGGSSACGAPSSWSTSPASTTSAPSPRAGRCPRPVPPPSRAAGCGDPVGPCSTRPPPPSAPCR